MKIKPQKGSWILGVLFLAAAFFPTLTHASATPGLNVTVYDNYWYNDSPPLPTETGRPIVGTTTASRVEYSFDSDPLFNMYEDFIVKYEGYITAPVSTNISFYPSADDGTKLYIDQVLVDDNWYDKGCCGTPTEPIYFEAGVSKAFTLWFYENGGGARVELYWDIGNGWEIVPDSAFTMEAVAIETTTTTSSTTTTTTTSTTTTTTTTTVAPTTTTTTTLAPTTTLEPTTTQTPTTLTPTTVETTTSTTAPAPPPITTTSTVLPLPIATTTTAVPDTTTTIQSTTTTALPIETTTTTTIPPTPEIKQEMSQEEAVSVATNKEILLEVSKEEASQIFASINVSEITDEQKSEIIDAVQDAPKEVKEAFEEEINIYADGFDDYVPVGSNIDVKTRRSLIAATTMISATTIGAVAAGPGSTKPSGPSPSGGGSGSENNAAARKEKDENEDDEEEESPEIEGPEGDEGENNFTKNSIFKYQEETMKRTFNPWGFIKKFAKETAALAFTISGTVIVFATLSGETRKITLIATSVAFAVHYINAMLQNDE